MPEHPDRKVWIKSDGNDYQLYKDGKPFKINGIAGYTHLKELSEAGGNTIRTWDTTHLDQILKEANQYHLSVVVGLYLPDNRTMQYFYDDEQKTAQQLATVTAFIRKYRNDPAILCWCLGNELNFPFRWKYRSFYPAYNRLIDMIHREDPNHPVTTTMVNVQPKNVFNIRWRTGIDFISLNLFGGLRTLKEDIDQLNWFWRGPYLITEWGIDGPWDKHPQTKWQSYLETNSAIKARDYASLYRDYIPKSDPRFLGSLVFIGVPNKNTHIPGSVFLMMRQCF